MIGTEADAIGVAVADGSPRKIEARHRERLAVVYVRQSSPQQVLEHRESAALQYGLARRAQAWGWTRDRVLVVDEDQGRSGASAQGRQGFQRLLAEVSLNHVGLVLGIEMSRLARSCKDWHQLLELCALFDTLLADQDGLYDPSDYNDRLLLGLKGTMSEAELHILRQRMNQGRLNKAQRGELFNHPPIGYVRGPSGAYELDPDEQVRAVVRLVFETFEELGSLHALLGYLVEHDIRLGIRPHHGPNRGRLEWRRPNAQTLRNLLHHPLYAGGYSWGRRPVDPRRKVPGRPGTGRTVVPAEQCAVLLKDRLPAYIPWEQYESNRRRLAANRRWPDRRGAAREGAALLNGLVVCGRCGCRMLVAYSASGNRPRYVCQRQRIDYGLPTCQGLVGRVLDELVSRQVLDILEPAALELSLSAAADVERDRQKLDAHWRQRLERSGYEVDRAARQYEAVEPENRLVARELEKRWEQALVAQRTVAEAYDRFGQERPSPLTAAQRTRIAALATDIPALWHAAPQTTACDRQTIVRHLIERVVVTAPPDSEKVEAAIHWAGGCVSRQSVRRPVARYEQLDDYAGLMARVADLHDRKQTAGQIAEHLNREGWHPPKRRTTFNRQMVRHLLARLGRTSRRPLTGTHQTLADDDWWLADLACTLGMPQPTLYRWISSGWVHARRWPDAGGRWILWADADELERLRRLRTCSRGQRNRPEAADLTTPKPRLVTS